MHLDLIKRIIYNFNPIDNELSVNLEIGPFASKYVIDAQIKTLKALGTLSVIFSKNTEIIFSLTPEEYKIFKQKMLTYSNKHLGNTDTTASDLFQEIDKIYRNSRALEEGLLSPLTIKKTEKKKKSVCFDDEDLVKIQVIPSRYDKAYQKEQKAAERQITLQELKKLSRNDKDLDVDDLPICESPDDLDRDVIIIKD